MKQVSVPLLTILIALYHIDKPAFSILPVQTGKSDTTILYSTNADSLGYMKEIVATKQKYINKPFSILLNDLKIPVKSYRSSHSNRIENSGIFISFDNSGDTRLKMLHYPEGTKDPVGLNIEWVSPIPRANVESHLTNEAGEWTTAEQNYYASQIVSDIIPWSTNGK